MYPEAEQPYSAMGKTALRDGRPLENLDFMIGREESHRDRLSHFLDRWHGNPSSVGDGRTSQPSAVPAGYGAKMARLTDLQNEVEALINSLHDIG